MAGLSRNKSEHLTSVIMSWESLFCSRPEDTSAVTSELKDNQPNSFGS